MEKVKVWVHVSWNTYSEKFEYAAYNCDMTDFGYHLIEMREIEISAPENTAQRVYNALMVQKQKIVADAWVQAQEIQERAEKLIALPASLSPTENYMNAPL